MELLLTCEERMVEKLSVSRKKFAKILLIFVVIIFWGIGTIETKEATVIGTLVVGMLVAIILNLEKMMIEVDNKNGCIWYAIYFAGILAIRWNPLRRVSLSSFDRILGECTKFGIDVTKRIHNFYFWFIGVAIVFALFYIGANYLKSNVNYEKNKEIYDMLDRLIIVGDALLLFRIIPFFNNASNNQEICTLSLEFYTLILLAGIFYIVLDLNKKIEVENYIKGMMASWLFCIFVIILFFDEWKDGRILLWSQIFVALLLISAIKLTSLNLYCEKVKYLTDVSIRVFAFIPFGTSFYIELITILNQHRIFISHLKIWYLVFGILFISVVSIIIAKVLKKKENNDWKRWTYPIIIIGMTCLYAQISVSGTYSADIFESANYSVLISDFLNYGKIPIIEHYGGHMLLDVIEGIIYGILNKDFWGAIFSPYSNYIIVIIALLFYFFIKEIWDKDAAIAVVLFLPFYNEIQYWGIGILVCLAILTYINKPSYLTAFILWGAIIWCALYRLDIGYAFGLATIATLIVLMFLYKQNRKIKFGYLAFMLGIWGIIGGSVWFGVCICKKINPISRIIEFLKISSSNQNWAYTLIGDTNTFVFSLVYFIIPFTVIFGMIYIFLYHKKCEGEKNIWVLLWVLGFSYFFNFPRGLTRHSLIEGTVNFNWTAFLFIALFVVLVTNKKMLFIPIFSLLLIGNTLMTTQESFNYLSIMDVSSPKIGSYTNDWKVGKFWEKIKEDKIVINRVKCNDELKETIDDYKNVIDELIEDNETYIDFTNKNFIYSAINKMDPVYISQSPGQLSGEVTQENFIEEMKEIPMVLMPCGNDDSLGISLDHVANTYRYYKISEYIYQNYMPLCEVYDRYVVWCLKDRYVEMSQKVGRITERGQDIKEKIIQNTSRLLFNNVKVTEGGDKEIIMEGVQEDPYVSGFEMLFNYKQYSGQVLNISLNYNADQIPDDATVDMYYTSDEGEGYSEDKVQKKKIVNSSGTVCFRIPITEYTKLRLDIPNGSIITINSLKINASICKMIDYGYDGPFDNGRKYYSLSHNYDLGDIPQIWATIDEKKSSNNEAIQTAVEKDGIFVFDLVKENVKKDGNYLKLEAENPSEEVKNVQLKVGVYQNGIFESKYIYNFTLKSGKNDYMFRISSDYYWYMEIVNSCMIECDKKISNVKMKILKGD